MLIGVMGLAQSGKSTTAEVLTGRFGFRRVALADPLKTMLASIGFTEAQLYGEEKSKVVPGLGVTPRFLMQALGMWGRRISADFWVRMWGRAVAEPLRTGQRVACDDIRFPNEVRAIHDRGGVVILVRRKGVEPLARWGVLGRALVRLGLKFPIHPSERLDRIAHLADYVIDNDGTVADLRAKVAEVTALALAEKTRARRAQIEANDNLPSGVTAAGFSLMAAVIPFADAVKVIV